MKKISILVLAIVMVAMSACGKKTVESGTLAGSWMGSLTVGQQSMRIVFNFTLDENDSITASMDSPDQGAMGIPVGPVTLEANELVVSAQSIMGEYRGTLVNDTLIEGKWSQAGNSLPLTLAKMKEALSTRKPQEPVAPYPYSEEEVTFYNDEFGINLAGTLTLPQGEGPFKAAIMITGSGGQNRNEELMGHKPFMVIADYLTRNGIAVLRYDDRGIGASEGVYASATSAELATDVEAAFQFLKGNPKIDSTYIGLIGHSEGGLIAPIVASSNQEVAFIVSLAGPGVKGMEVILQQGTDIGRAMGAKEKQLQKSQALNEQIYNAIISETDNTKASANAEQILRSYLKKRLILKKLVDIQVNASMASLAPEGLDWFRYFFVTDPATFWVNVDCPVLAMNGGSDLQVEADVNLPAIENALKEGGNNDYEIMLMPGLNHLFQHSESGSPSEYGTIEETFSEGALTAIVQWINKL